MMFGALGLGLLADRWGRKPVLIVATLVFGVGSLVCATAESYEALLVYRFVTGLGLGGAMPNTIALTAEYTPKRFRATAVMLMFCGVSLGAAVGGFVAAALIEEFGWRSIFVVGGVLPICAAALAAVLLPESIRFLVLKGGRAPDVARYVAKLVARIAPALPLAGASFDVAEKPAAGSQVRELFAERRLGVTVLLWAIFFMSLLDLYFLNNWLPTIMNEAGISLSTAAAITALFQLGGTAGAIVLGRLDGSSPVVQAARGDLRRRVRRGGRDRDGRRRAHVAEPHDFRRGILRDRRADRVERARGGVLSDRDSFDRRRVGARDRQDRVDHRAVHRRLAALVRERHPARVLGRRDTARARGVRGARCGGRRCAAAGAARPLTSMRRERRAITRNRCRAFRAPRRGSARRCASRPRSSA